MLLKIKFILYCITFLLLHFSLSGQHLHLGGGVLYSFKPSLTIIDKEFFIASAPRDNQTGNFYIKTAGLNEEPSITNIISPNAYIKFNTKNHFFAKTEINSFIMQANFAANSKGNFSGNYNGTYLANPFHQSTYATFFFLRNSFDLGINPIVFKRFKPALYAGISKLLLYKLSIKQPDYNISPSEYDPIDEVNYGLLAGLVSNFKKNTFYYRFGAGFQFYNFSLDINYEKNLFAIDNSSDSYFNTYSNLYLELSINLLSINLTRNKSKTLND